MTDLSGKLHFPPSPLPPPPLSLSTAIVAWPRCAVFLASDDALFVQGVTLAVDGGPLAT